MICKTSEPGFSKPTYYIHRVLNAPHLPQLVITCFVRPLIGQNKYTRRALSPCVALAQSGKCLASCFCIFILHFNISTTTVLKYEHTHTHLPDMVVVHPLKEWIGLDLVHTCSTNPVLLLAAEPAQETCSLSVTTAHFTSRLMLFVSFDMFKTGALASG